MSKQNVLVGRTLTGIKIASDKGAILFQTDTGDVIARADGACCSHTWVESIELPARGFPAIVSAVENIELNSGLDDRDGELAYYGCQITTDSGHIIIDYRNESNGYYGGNLSWPDDSYFYGGVYNQNVSNEDWQELAK